MIMQSRSKTFLLFCAGLTACIFLVATLQQQQPTLWRSIRPISGVKTANATLGFGAIAVLSTQDSPRRDRLLQAANVTEIQLFIPTHPQWSEEQTNPWTSQEQEPPGIGSVRAALNHLDILRQFLLSDLETILVLEDDVDWDINLRTKQVPRAAAAVRQLLSSSAAPAESYWTEASKWDILWIGHCGDYWTNPTVEGIDAVPHTPELLNQLPHRLFDDNTLPNRSDLHPFTSDFLNKLHIPENMRLVHEAVSPLCSFAYAITRQGAKRLLELDVKRPHDVRLLNACAPIDGVAGTSLLKCFVVNPELFHHQDSDLSEIFRIEHLSPPSMEGRPPVDRVGHEQVLQRHETTNIECGVKNDVYKWRDSDQWNPDERLHYLQSQIAKGNCLKHTADSGAISQ